MYSLIASSFDNNFVTLPIERINRNLNFLQLNQFIFIMGSSEKFVSASQFITGNVMQVLEL